MLITGALLNVEYVRWGWGVCVHLDSGVFCVHVCKIRKVSEGGETSSLIQKLPKQGICKCKVSAAETSCCVVGIRWLSRKSVGRRQGQGDGKDKVKQVLVNPAPTDLTFRLQPKH